MEDKPVTTTNTSKESESEKVARENFLKEFLAEIRGGVAGYSKRTWIIVIILNLVLAGAIFGGVWYFISHRSPDQIQLDPENGYTKNIRNLEQEKPPTDPMERAAYYSQLGSNYETLQFKDKALEYYLEAQKIVDEHHLQDISFNQAIGDIYAQQKNHRRANEYYRREIVRLEAYKNEHSEEAASVDKLIKILQDKVKG